MILADQDDLEGAMTLHKREEEICRESQDPEGLALSLANQAKLLSLHGNHKKAQHLAEEAYQLAVEQGLTQLAQEIKERLVLVRGQGAMIQAFMLMEQGDKEGALALLKEEEKVCRELDEPRGLAYSLAGQVLLLGKEMGRPHQALPLAEEACQLATSQGMTGVIQQMRLFLDSLRAES